MKPVIIELEGLRKTYGPTVALEAIDLSVHAGEFLTLLGPSGSGKTTLLNLIAGSINPTGGRISIQGREVTGLPSSQRGLGMVFQNYALFPHMSIFENIAFPLRIRRVPEPEIRRKVEGVLELVQLPGMSARKPKELSGGQQQRISIARCLVYDPPLILMDEPLGALDKKLREQMQLEIKRLHKSLLITILYVTHDQEEALTMSDRICVLDAGRIAQLGTPAELYFRPASKYVADFLGESNFIPAQVDKVEPTTRLCGPGKAVIEAQPYDGLSPGAQVSVMIRPESLRIADSATTSNSLRGIVEDVIFVGGTTTFIVKIAGDLIVKMRTLTNETETLKPGNDIFLSFRPEAARIFAPNLRG